MTEDFVKRLDRLEELANKATPGPWYNVVVESDFSVVSTDMQDDNKSIAIEPIEEKDSEYIAAANPAMIKEMIAELRRLEEEANWLTETLAAFCRDYVAGCATCPNTEKPCKETVANDWREAAGKAVR